MEYSKLTFNSFALYESHEFCRDEFSTMDRVYGLECCVELYVYEHIEELNFLEGLIFGPKEEYPLVVQIVINNDVVVEATLYGFGSH